MKRNALTDFRNSSYARKPGWILEAHRAFIRPKSYLLICLLCALAALMIWAIAVGSYEMSLFNILRSLLGMEQGHHKIVVWGIRMPRIVAAVVTGCGLGLSGLATQSLLRNPLSSPFTLGISQGAAFGAAFSIVAIGAGGMQESALRTADASAFTIHSVYAVTFFAFLGAVTATLTILLLARFKKMSPEAIILAGVALSSLFTSGTILVQYFATEVEIATVVFWTFGDVARSNWREIGLLGFVTVLVIINYVYNRWNPDIIFIDSGGNERVRQDYVKKPDFYDGLKAFKERQVHILHAFNWYMTNLGTVLADAYTVGKILYSKQFEDVDIASKADEIYAFLLGKSVYQQMAKNFGLLGEVPVYLK